ncbi:PEP-CTERM sorting domain-containing protein [Fuerstiella marisgermanici]|uniref:PEP-CTERM protein sorting domain protein n=1 Tax=Fuerstiella marisgermanici TaxID=1891926 RepID=A0A1P8W8Q5_9PLAN|nr:PEP-CTERM sorting domain-containing protein [Fuerstiella marisgermanici]APZ90439.1 PEP-CTERM protein sorting domain protein [Fuerstiella marisgermanici]
MICLSSRAAFRRSCCLVAVVVSSIFYSSADGGIVATISTTPLANNSPNQKLSLFLHSDSGVLNDVESFSVYAEIGNGLATQTGVPIFQSYTWDAAITAQMGLAIPSGFTPEVANNFRATPGLTDFESPPLGDISDNSVTIGTTPTLVGEFDIDTSVFGGIFDQSFSFFIGNAPGGGGAVSELNSLSEGTLPFSFTGTFDVGNPVPVGVPEPSTFALLGLGGLGLVIRQRRRKSAIAVQAS